MHALSLLASCAAASHIPSLLLASVWHGLVVVKTFVGPVSSGRSGLTRLTDTTTRSNMDHPFVTNSQKRCANILRPSSIVKITVMCESMLVDV